MSGTPQQHYAKPTIPQAVEVVVRYNPGITRTEVSERLGIPDVNQAIRWLVGEAKYLREEPGGRLYATRP